jgi:hypothetical protein
MVGHAGIEALPRLSSIAPFAPDLLVLLHQVVELVLAILLIPFVLLDLLRVRLASPVEIRIDLSALRLAHRGRVGSIDPSFQEIVVALELSIRERHVFLNCLDLQLQILGLLPILGVLVGPRLPLPLRFGELLFIGGSLFSAALHLPASLILLGITLTLQDAVLLFAVRLLVFIVD